jgi:hypothetical protein
VSRAIASALLAWLTRLTLGLVVAAVLATLRSLAVEGRAGTASSHLA